MQHFSEAERDALLLSAIGKFYECRMWLDSVLKGLVLSVLPGMLIFGVAEASNITNGFLYAGLVVSLFWAGLSLTVYQFTVYRIREQIRAYIQEQRNLGEKPPVCLACGYVIEASATRCPECGAVV